MRPNTHAPKAPRARSGRIILTLSALAVLGASRTDSPRHSSDVPSLKMVLDRLARYSVGYGDALESVVADEDYIQELIQRSDGQVFQRRRLQSEIAFVRLSETSEWLAFRNVRRVDGAEVGSDPGRLAQLFHEGKGSILEQGRLIASESARYNIGSLRRNLNIPTIVLQFLLPHQQGRFKFEKKGEASSSAGAVWIVEYKERQRNTIIRTNDRRDVPAEGRLWVVPEDGRIVRATLNAKNPVRTELQFTWQPDAKLNLWVPAEMRELYRGTFLNSGSVPGPPQQYDIRGVARYSNYRRFNVDFRIK